MAIVRLVNSAGTPLPRMEAALEGEWVGVDSKGSETRSAALSKAVFKEAVWEGEFLVPGLLPGDTISYLELEGDFSDNSFYQDTKLRVKVKTVCEKVIDPKSGKVEERCKFDTPSDMSIFATNITRDKAAEAARRVSINAELVASAVKKVAPVLPPK
tara:strand:+ start:2009 stop:2479 length:471 start_codon:yes stop_codon:yes gene_type:complete